MGAAQQQSPSGSTTLPGDKGGENEDGFYELLSEDAADADPEIFVNGFGPFANGDVVKITEDPDATPESKKMGSGKGQAGAIAAHLILNSDPMVSAFDDADPPNEGTATCFVPPPPK